MERFYVVSTVTIQPDNKVVIGGSFGTEGGVERYYLARLNLVKRAARQRAA